MTHVQKPTRRGRPLLGDEPLTQMIGFRVSAEAARRLRTKVRRGETEHQAARRIFSEALGVKS